MGNKNCVWSELLKKIFLFSLKGECKRDNVWVCIFGSRFVSFLCELSVTPSVWLFWQRVPDLII